MIQFYIAWWVGDQEVDKSYNYVPGMESYPDFISRMVKEGETEGKEFLRCHI